MVSGTSVGAPFDPDQKLFAALGSGMAPDAKNRAAFGSINEEGILLPGNCCPGVKPRASNLAICAGSLVFGTVIGVPNELKSPLRCACGTAGAVIWLAVTNLRHSWFQKKKVFLREVL